MNDYPKFGVWPDGYYMSLNQFNQASLSWGGQGVVVFERDKMLLGQTARGVYFDLYGTDPNLGSMLPSDLDGSAPPAGTPNYFMENDDDAWGYSPDQVQIWKFQTNWASPGSSTFTFAGALPVAAFDANLCGYSRNCIPQPGGVKLDALSDRLMYRLQYRNFGSYQTLVTNHTVDVNDADRAGIRWYELRNTGGGWSVYQQGTFSPDSNHRWMGSAAMNSAGDIALGYSVSSIGVYPSIRYTGRLSTDPLGQMTQGETTMMPGSGYQTHSSGRWGDYSAMSVDTDDCAFWYTQEYYQTVSSAGWQTRVGSFNLRTCGAPPTPPDAPASLTAAAFSSSQINLVWTNVTNEDGFRIERSTNNVNFSEIASVGANVTSYSNSGLSASTLYYYRVYAYNAGGNSNYSNTASATTLAAPAIHVGDLDGSPVVSRNNWKATVTVTVHDAGHATVQSATVSGTWSGGYSGSSSCTTGSSGTCTITSGNIPKNKTTETFMVTNVTKAGSAYSSGANHDVDGGTNGTSITVSKP